MNNIRSARKLYDMRAILGLPSQKNVIVCPLPLHRHVHNTPSFSIYVKNGVQRFHCHGSCGLDGDVIDLVGYMSIPGYSPSDSQHVKRSLALLDSGHKISPPKLTQKKPTALPRDLWKSFLPSGHEVQEYASRRGLTPDTLRKFGVGQYTTTDVYQLGIASTWMTIPTMSGGRLEMIKMRNILAVGKKDRYRTYPGSTAGLFNFNNVYGRVGPVAIAKAEISAMLLDQYGILACAPTAGEGNSEQEMYLPIAFSERRVVIGDNDPEPIAEKTLAHLRERGALFKASIRLPPAEYHDVDDWVLAEPEIAIPTIKAWLTEKHD